MSYRHFAVLVSFILAAFMGPGQLFAAPDGALLYAENCAACHGEDGRGGVGVPLAMEDFLGGVSDEYLATSIRMGRPGRVMPAFPAMSDAQVRAVVKYIRGWAPEHPALADLKPVEGDPARGADLYAQHCAACHGENAEGGTGTGVTFSRPRNLPIIAPALNNAGFLAAASDGLIKHTLIQGRQGTPMTSFLDKGLTEVDINDVVAYVRSLESEAQLAARESGEEEPAVLVYESPYSVEQTVESVKAAAVAANYRIIRVQNFDHGLVNEKDENAMRVMVYFCNFGLLNEVLAIDPRVGLFLPCRVTVEEREGKVYVMTTNPMKLSGLFNNDELGRACKEMQTVYTTILEEATL